MVSDVFIARTGPITSTRPPVVARGQGGAAGRSCRRSFVPVVRAAGRSGGRDRYAVVRPGRPAGGTVRGYVPRKAILPLPYTVVRPLVAHVLMLEVGVAVPEVRAPASGPPVIVPLSSMSPGL